MKLYSNNMELRDSWSFIWFTFNGKFKMSIEYCIKWVILHIMIRWVQPAIAGVVFVQFSNVESSWRHNSMCNRLCHVMETCLHGRNNASSVFTISFRHFYSACVPYKTENGKDPLSFCEQTLEWICQKDSLTVWVFSDWHTLMCSSSSMWCGVWCSTCQEWP